MGARVVGTRPETATARTLVLDAPELGRTVAGQHIDIRLTAEDGYTAQRSYSLASPTAASPVEVTIERFENGEVSPYLVDAAEVGDAVEVRGPIGGWFVWRAEQTEPVQLIAGGSGLVPLMAMIRTHATTTTSAPFRLLLGVTDPDRRYYRDELDRLTGDLLEVDVRYSRRAPVGDPTSPGRITRDDLERFTIPASAEPTVYVCGPTGFVEAVADTLADLGHATGRIRTERFGPSG